MKYLILVLFVGLLMACGKDNKSKKEYTGYLVHRISNQPIANEKINLQIKTTHLGAKSDEFPQGIPTFITNNYQAVTDTEGKFTLVAEDSQLYFYSVVNKSWIVSSAVRAGYSIGIGQPGFYRKYDTLYAERPGYVEYQIRNTNDWSSIDSLFVGTPYIEKWVVPSKSTDRVTNVLDMGPYNWLFVGKDVDKTIYDTIPAESFQELEVLWAHKRIDTITKKTATIQVSPGATTIYRIEY